MKNETQLIELPIENLITAEWNYKKAGEREAIDKLKASISVDKSVGVLAVREVKGKFEVMDGNHRLVAIQELGWKSVPCENFGPVSIAKAVTIARRRNHKWFDDDIIKLGKLYDQFVLPEIPMEELLEFMPDSLSDIESMVNLGKADWSPAETNPAGSGGEKEAFHELILSLPESVMNMWMEWKTHVRKDHESMNEIQVFEYAIAEALGTINQESKEAFDV